MPIELTPVQPEEAIRAFEAKGYRLGYSWQDTWHEEHSAHFTVAKVARLDLLEDIRGAVDAAIKNGTTLEQFKRDLTPTLRAKGWWGRQSQVDPLTGEEEIVQLGSPRRLQTIFDVNMRTAYAAGHWERIERVKARRRWLLYVIVDDARTRPQHRAWSYILLPVDHPFWRTHYPPNGWKCRCMVRQLSDRDVTRFGYKASSDADVETFMKSVRKFQNRRTGEVVDVPVGIDPGWAYNVGQARMKNITPPPLTSPLAGPYSGPPAAVPAPAARPAPRSRLLPDGQPPEHYVDAFLQEFGATRQKPVVFRDAIDEPLVISDDLFKDIAGRWKVGKRDRARYLLILADALKSPDEIWWVWQTLSSGKVVLRRRYLTKLDLDGASSPLIAVFETGRDGWTGVTSFQADSPGYLDGQRRGTLAWRRPDTR